MAMRYGLDRLVKLTHSFIRGLRSDEKISDGLPPIDWRETGGKNPGCLLHFFKYLGKDPLDLAKAGGDIACVIYTIIRPFRLFVQ